MDELNKQNIAVKAAKAIVDNGSIQMAVLKSSIAIEDKVGQLLNKEIELPEAEPFPEIPEFPSEMAISNLPEVQKVEVVNPSDFEELKNVLEKIYAKEDEEVDFSDTNMLLEGILNQLQTETSDVEEYKELKQIVEKLVLVKDSIDAIDIPSFDYAKLAKIIKDNLNINVSTRATGAIKNKQDIQINPATEEKQNEIIAAIQSGGGGGGGASVVGIKDESDVRITPAKETTQVTLRQLLEGILEAIQSVKILGAVRGTSADLRVTAVGGTVTTVTTVSTVSTVSTVANQTSIGGFAANQIVPSQQNLVAVMSNINNIKIT